MPLDSLTPAPVPAAQTPPRPQAARAQSGESSGETFNLPRDEAGHAEESVSAATQEPRADRQASPVQASSEQDPGEPFAADPALASQAQPTRSAAESPEVVLNLESTGAAPAETSPESTAEDEGATAEPAPAAQPPQNADTETAPSEQAPKPVDPTKAATDKPATVSLPVGHDAHASSQSTQTSVPSSAETGTAKPAPSATPTPAASQPGQPQADRETAPQTAQTTAAETSGKAPVAPSQEPAGTPQGQAQSSAQSPAQPAAQAQDASAPASTQAVPSRHEAARTPQATHNAPADPASPAQAAKAETPVQPAPSPGPTAQGTVPNEQAQATAQAQQARTEGDSLAAPGQQVRERQNRTDKSSSQDIRAVDPARSAQESKAPAQAAPTATASSTPSSLASLPPALQSLLSADPLTALSPEALIANGGETSIDPAIDLDTELGLIRQDTRAEALRPGAQNAALARFTPQTTQTLAAQIARKFSDGARVFDIRLDPQELGRVDVRLELGPDNRVSAILSAERSETLAELQRSARDLERALEEAGLDLSEDGLSFNLSDGSNPFEESEGYEAFATDEKPDFSLTVETPASTDVPEQAVYGFAVSQRTGLNVTA